MRTLSGRPSADSGTDEMLPVPKTTLDANTLPSVRVSSAQGARRK